MNPGQRVMLICSLWKHWSGDASTPSPGAMGKITALADYDGYRVLYDKYPCQQDDPTWWTHKSCIIPVYLHDKPIDSCNRGVAGC